VGFKSVFGVVKCNELKKNDESVHIFETNHFGFSIDKRMEECFMILLNYFSYKRRKKKRKEKDT
jgi:hypothetical protein